LGFKGGVGANVRGLNSNFLKSGQNGLKKNWYGLKPKYMAVYFILSKNTLPKDIYGNAF
jgi:hypothetical protein